MVRIGGLKNQIRVVLLVVGLVPLLVSSYLLYHFARQNIVDDRVEIYLKHLSQQNADKIDLFLTERRSESAATASERFWPQCFDLARAGGTVSEQQVAEELNQKIRRLEVYDISLLVDVDGRIKAVNSVNRFGERFDPRIVSTVAGEDIRNFPEEAAVWRMCLSEGSAIHDWYSSKIVHRLYVYDDDDIARSFHVAFGQEVGDPITGKPCGVMLFIMNAEFIQGILDLVESDFKRYGLASGQAMVLNMKTRVVLAAPQRKNRRGFAGVSAVGSPVGNLAPFTGIDGALADGAHTIKFLLDGTTRYGGVARLSLIDFRWTVVVSLNEEDIFQPVSRMKYAFIGALVFSMALISASAWLLSGAMGRPLQKLKASAMEVAEGHFDGRLDIRGSDEIEVLAVAFNRMADTIRDRQLQLETMNRSLEEKVLLRTQALEESNTDLRHALGELHAAQDQLVQSEKLASLGRLVAGIAHEIKNPLNFIYGNTKFIDEYITSIEEFFRAVGGCAAFTEPLRAEAEALADGLNIPFIMKDMRLIATNIHEGAARIRAIVDDLRTFARAPTASKSPTDVRRVLDMCLNLLRNQYKNRIAVRREYGDVPQIDSDVGKIEQVFLNLLTNAIHAIDGDGEIVVRAFTRKEWVVVEIQDSGKGIAPGNLDMVFEPFFTTKEVGQGTGLGLSISYNIVNQHGGKISVRNARPGGALFTVELPAGGKVPAPDSGHNADRSQLSS